MRTLTWIALAIAVVGCSAQPPAPAAAPTGITSNNGGADRALGNQPSVGVSTRVQ